MCGTGSLGLQIRKEHRDLSGLLWLCFTKRPFLHVFGDLAPEARSSCPCVPASSSILESVNFALIVIAFVLFQYERDDVMQELRRRVDEGRRHWYKTARVPFSQACGVCGEGIWKRYCLRVIPNVPALGREASHGWLA